MKQIELTKDHKSKLLEMCKELFPKYTIIPDNPNPNFLTISWFTNLGYFINLMNDETKENTLIHWFEFVMTHLCDKIASNLTNEMCTGMPQYYNKSEKLDWNSQSLISMLKECHPIDYLYEEFKKLK